MTPVGTSFALSKWYLDCVSERGDVFIGYAASLSWKKIRLHQVAALSCVDEHTPGTEFGGAEGVRTGVAR